MALIFLQHLKYQLLDHLHDRASVLNYLLLQALSSDLQILMTAQRAQL